MLTRLTVKNLTVFAEADFQFAAGLNVVVGENGAGKSHVLKTAYTVAAVSAWGEKESGSSTPTKSYLETAIARKLRGVFRPDALGRLARRQAGRNRCEIEVRFHSQSLRLGFSFNTASKTEVGVDPCPTKWERALPVYLPTRELLTIYPGFVSLYETTELSFEETWRDTCLLLGAPLAKGPRLGEVKHLLEPLEEQLGGKVVLDDGRFYVKTPTGSIEAHLVAEGLRKLAMIARLIAAGSLIGKGSLFWDEPEANLNPKVIKRVARTILQLCLSGVQVFVATHSLFLLRELDILLKNDEFKEVKARFFGLHPDGDGIVVQQGSTVDEIGTIDALDEELHQSDRYLGGGGRVVTTITEGALAFDFPAGWRATKYDEWTFYLNHFQNVCGGAKGVDIVALHPNRCLWLIEIKDYRAGPRQKALELVEEVAVKVRDSLAGLAAARLRAKDANEADMANRALGAGDMKVVLHLEQPVRPTRLHPVEDVSKLLQKLKQLLRAIDYHPRVTNRGEGNRFGWDVREA